MTESQESAEAGRAKASMGLIDVAITLVDHWSLLVLGSLAVGLATLGATYLIPPVYTARLTFVPPQQQSAAASALANLGALGSLATVAANVRSPAEQYVSLMQSATIADRLVEKFDLIGVYEVKFRVDARTSLARNSRIALGKRDGLIVIEVDDEIPTRAAEMASAYVDELRALTSRIALTEAQQRRAFFEAQLAQTRDNLTRAQRALEGSGFTANALKTEPREAAIGYASLRAQLTAAEVRLQVLRRGLNDSAPEVQQQLAALVRLRSEITKLEASSSASGPDYIGRYREFKYQEKLYELFSREFELARVDESRESTLIQVVDPATVPEVKTRPKRALIAITATALGFLVLMGVLLAKRAWREMPDDAPARVKWAQSRGRA